MYKLIKDYGTGIRIFNIAGRGIVIALSNNEYNNQVGDKWVFQFSNHSSKVSVKGVEKVSYSNKLVGLCFGNQFSQSELQELNSCDVKFIRVTDN